MTAWFETRGVATLLTMKVQEPHPESLTQNAANEMKRSSEARHARPRAGHPRLNGVAARKSWMAGHRRAEATPSFGRLCPAMTKRESG
jgi:hypothetical protein